MFKFLKEKLKKSIKDISSKIDEEGVTEETEQEVPVEQKEESPEVKPKVEEKKGFFSKIKEKFKKKAEEEIPKEEIETPEEEATKVPEIKDEKPKTSDKLDAKPLSEEIIKEKVEKKDIPTIQELTERKEEKEKTKEPEIEKPKIESKKESREDIIKKIKKEVEEEPIEEKKPEIKEIPKEEPVKEKETIEEIQVIQEETKAEEEVIKKIKEEVEKEPIVEEKPEIKEIPKEGPIKEEETIEDIKEEETKEVPVIKEELEIEEEKVEKKRFFQKIRQKITTKKIDQKTFEDIFWNLEIALLENNVAVEVIERIKEDLSNEIVDKPLARGKIEAIIEKTLKKSIKDIVDIDSFKLLDKIGEKKPFVICFVGINGSGKTTTIAKMARLLMDNNLSVILAAADTFRAAAIDQLQYHGDKLGIKVIKQDYGSDPAAVAYDAVKHAKSKGTDVVLIDTAGRIHSNINLTDEMKKIVRVSQPDLKIFVGESITGNDCVEQAKKFNEAIGIDAIILSKADIDEKGGAAISVSYVTKKPILYIGTGQEYTDIKVFDPALVMDNLGLE